MLPSRAERIRRDLVGGITAATIAIPLSLGFGMFVFVTLGDEYFAFGAVAGLLAAAMAGLVCVLLGERTPTIYAPRVTITFFLGLLLYSLIHSQNAVLQSASPAMLLMALFSIMLLAGLFQALFGLLRMGTLIKFAPHPVMAGFQNMAAVLLVLVQLGNVLGFDRNVPFTLVFTQLADAKPASIAVALITFSTMWNARKIAGRVPATMVGISFGISFYYAFQLMGLPLGPAIGMPAAEVTMPHPYAEFTNTLFLSKLMELTPTIIGSALALAIIAAIDAMLCAKLAGRRGDSNHMLVRLGLANAASAAVGGITNSINIGATVTNKAFGGHSWLSVAVSAAIMALALSLAIPLITQLPRVVISAVIMVVAIQHIDPWSKKALFRVFSPTTRNRAALALDLGVAILVSVLSIAVNIVLAVFIGLALAVSLFVLRMSRSNLRRQYRCDTVRSRKTRSAADRAFLDENGRSILVLELHGALFFGSAERLAKTIEIEVAHQTKAVILDLRRVTDVDSTASRILTELDTELTGRGLRLMLVFAPLSSTSENLEELAARRFPDIDRAIEAAEDDLLGEQGDKSFTAIPLAGVSVLREMSPEQISTLTPYLLETTWPAKSIIFEQGDPGSHLFLITRGRASVRLQTKGGDIRLITFSPGTVFGELALLDHGQRSATVTADEDLTAWALSDKSFKVLQTREPGIAISLLSALGRELSIRLRQANTTIHQLEA